MSATSRARALILSLALVAVAAGCAGAPSGDSTSAASAAGHFPVTIKNCGMDVTVKAEPTRAVALNQGTIEQTLALGLEKQLVGTAYLDDKVNARWQQAYDAIPVLSAKYPTKEVLASKNPDFVLASYASAFTDKAVGTREELQNQGIATFLDPYACPNQEDRPAATFDGVWQALTDVATLFGHPDQAEKLVAAQRQQLAQVQEAKAGNQLKVLWWDSETDAPFVGGSAGGPAMIMNAVGATNVFSDVNKGWGTVSWEKVLAADPDVIVVADASWSTAQSKIDYIEHDPTLSALTAVQKKRFVIVPFSESTPGATLIDGAVSVSSQIKEFH